MPDSAAGKSATRFVARIITGEGRRPRPSRVDAGALAVVIQRVDYLYRPRGLEDGDSPRLVN